MSVIDGIKFAYAMENVGRTFVVSNQPLAGKTLRAAIYEAIDTEDKMNSVHGLSCVASITVYELAKITRP